MPREAPTICAPVDRRQEHRRHYPPCKSRPGYAPRPCAEREHRRHHHAPDTARLAGSRPCAVHVADARPRPAGGEGNAVPERSGNPPPFFLTHPLWPSTHPPRDGDRVGGYAKTTHAHTRPHRDARSRPTGETDRAYAFSWIPQRGPQVSEGVSTAKGGVGTAPFGTEAASLRWGPRWGQRRKARRRDGHAFSCSPNAVPRSCSIWRSPNAVPSRGFWCIPQRGTRGGRRGTRRGVASVLLRGMTPGALAGGQSGPDAPDDRPSATPRGNDAHQRASRYNDSGSERPDGPQSDGTRRHRLASSDSRPSGRIEAGWTRLVAPERLPLRLVDPLPAPSGASGGKRGAA